MVNPLYSEPYFDRSLDKATMTLPNKEYLVLWAEMAASVAAGMFAGCPESPSPEDEQVAHKSLLESRLLLDDLDIHPVTPIPAP